jgi:hypothetical protein
MEETKRRPGRPLKNPEQGNKKQASWWLASDVLKAIKQQPNQAEYIESLVRKDIGEQ